MFFISHLFNKLTQTVLIRRITAYEIAVAFNESFSFKYGPLETLLSENWRPFVAYFYLRGAQIFRVKNSF